MEWEVGDYEDWYMTSSFYNIFRDGYWETAARDSYVTQYNGHTHSTICSEYHICHDGPLGCDNGVTHNGIHCVAINSKNLDGSGSVQNVFNGGGNSIVCTVNMSYSLSGASR
ncbi:hypothetical protein EOM86_14735 [Candidatus Nomurabacteria bacterium]|nr:hypothetical protein [Candidatus Nomurabacteria bacterium]